MRFHDYLDVGGTTLQKVSFSHDQMRMQSSLSERVQTALVSLELRGAYLKQKHSDAADKWNRDGQQGPYPVRDEPPLNRLFNIFNEIFPQISISHNMAANQLEATKNGMLYGPSSFSDGEKQVYSILADFIELGDSFSLILIDEPELNLHPQLAERLWTTIEDKFPEKTFIYATHSISFALRRNVERVFVLGTNSPAVLDSLADLQKEDSVALLGSLPGILSARKVLVTEGEATGKQDPFDADFYRWLLQDNSVKIHNAGGCNEVIAIAKREGFWKSISTDIELKGVVDADYGSQRASPESVFVLPFHEAESYLCLPEIICAVAEKIGSIKEMPTHEAVKKIIFERLENERVKTAALRTTSRLQLNVSISAPKEIRDQTNSAHCLNLIKTEASKAVERAMAVFSEQELDKHFAALT
jgi:energy-coupling factor transporter ATP-binding protein EcfA2